MNYRRGFFRLWLVLSLLWVAGTGLIFANINHTFIPDEAFVMKDATSGFYKLDNYFDRYEASFKAAHHEIKFPNNVTLFVVTSVPESVMKAKSPEFYEEYSKPRDGEMRTALFDYWSKGAMVAIIPPFILLCAGLLLGWIIAGFSRSAGS